MAGVGVCLHELRSTVVVGETAVATKTGNEGDGPCSTREQEVLGATCRRRVLRRPRHAALSLPQSMATQHTSDEDRGHPQVDAPQLPHAYRQP